MRICVARLRVPRVIFARGMTTKGCSRGQVLVNKCEGVLAPNYGPLPLVLSKGKGVYVYDIDGKEYLDFVAGHASVTLGHCHPKIYKAIAGQMKKFTVASRHFYSKCLVNYAEQLTQLFCYDKILPTSTATESAESAIKIARKWGYKVKGIPANEAKVIFPENNHWGHSLAAISASTEPKKSEDFGPFVAGFDVVPFNNVDCLAEKLKDPTVCAYMVEPIQVDAGVVVPDMSYFKKVRDACSDNNVLFIADESHCGLGRAGSLLTSDIYQVRPDIMILGKALSAGIMPVSAVMADNEVMCVLEPETHGSTFGGSPLSCRLALTALKVLQDERLPDNAKDMGTIFREELCDLPREIITEVRGMGLLNAIVVHDDLDAKELSMDLMKNGLLTEPPRKQTICLTPPLTIREKDILKASQIIRKCVNGVKIGGKGKDKDKIKCMCQRVYKAKKARKRARRPRC